MRMVNFVVRDAIVPNLKSTARDDAIREIVGSLSAAGAVPEADCDDIVKAILRREALGTTGIGHHIAIPHTRHAAAAQLIGTIGISKGGIAFQSIDDEPVNVVVLLISPPDRPGDHLRALENVVNAMRDGNLVRALQEAPDRDAIWRLIDGGAGA